MVTLTVFPSEAILLQFFWKTTRKQRLWIEDYQSPLTLRQIIQQSPQHLIKNVKNITWTKLILTSHVERSMHNVHANAKTSYNKDFFAIDLSEKFHLCNLISRRIAVQLKEEVYPPWPLTYLEKPWENDIAQQFCDLSYARYQLVVSRLNRVHLENLINRPV